MSVKERIEDWVSKNHRRHFRCLLLGSHQGEHALWDVNVAGEVPFFTYVCKAEKLLEDAELFDMAFEHLEFCRSGLRARKEAAESLMRVLHSS